MTREVKTKYQIYLVDPDTGRPTLQGGWDTQLARFDDLSDAEQAVAELERAYPGTEWEIRDPSRPARRVHSMDGHL